MTLDPRPGEANPENTNRHRIGADVAKEYGKGGELR
jgi:hypothetical protein